jgi:hypothetical protein
LHGSKFARLLDKVPRLKGSKRQGSKRQGSKVTGFQESKVAGFQGVKAPRFRFQSSGITGFQSSPECHRARFQGCTTISRMQVSIQDHRVARFYGFRCFRVPGFRGSRF